MSPTDLSHPFAGVNRRPANLSGHNSRNADAMGRHTAHMPGNKLPVKPHRTTSRACCVDEEVARLHLEEIGAKLTKLTKNTSACRWKALPSRSTTGIEQRQI